MTFPSSCLISPRTHPSSRSNAHSSARFPFTTPSLPLVCNSGFALIVGVLGRGLHALYVGNRERSYRMMRYRVLFQGGTIVALVFGMYYRPNVSVDPALGHGTVVDKRFFLDYAKEHQKAIVGKRVLAIDDNTAVARDKEQLE